MPGVDTSPWRWQLCFVTTFNLHWSTCQYMLEVHYCWHVFLCLFIYCYRTLPLVMGSYPYLVFSRWSRESSYYFLPLLFAFSLNCLQSGSAHPRTFDVLWGWLCLCFCWCVLCVYGSSGFCWPGCYPPLSAGVRQQSDTSVVPSCLIHVYMPNLVRPSVRPVWPNHNLDPATDFLSPPLLPRWLLKGLQTPTSK